MMGFLLLLLTVLLLTFPFCYARIKLFASNERVSDVTYTQTVRSLLDCSIIYDRSKSSLSFNYKGDTKTCELTEKYPESSTSTAGGWKVYANIVDGVWADWTNWDGCTVTCGGGTKTRSRTCSNPAPSNGGAFCPGSSTDNGSCNEQSCPVDGAWTAWTNWGSCTFTCGGGQWTRTRTCTDPAPNHGGASCTGPSSEDEECNEHFCPVDGAWAVWMSWSVCTVTCGGGQKTRTRTCTNPSPSNGGVTCAGSSTDNAVCNGQGCPVDGAWALWTGWGACTVPCGGGQMTRTRSCSNPSPTNGGANCPGVSTEAAYCNGHKCC